MSSEQRIKSNFYKDARKICREVGVYLDAEATDDALDIICELAWQKLKLYGSDLELFTKHAKRNTVNGDDVILLVRRNDSLKVLLEEKRASMSSDQGSKAGTSGVKRKRKESATVN